MTDETARNAIGIEENVIAVQEDMQVIKQVTIDTKGAYQALNEKKKTVGEDIGAVYAALMAHTESDKPVDPLERYRRKNLTK